MAPRELTAPTALAAHQVRAPDGFLVAGLRLALAVVFLVGAASITRGSARAVLVGAIVATALIGASRIAFMTLTIDAAGITARNFWRTRSVAWADVERVRWQATRFGGVDVPVHGTRLEVVHEDGLGFTASAAWCRGVQGQARVTLAVRRAAPSGTIVEGPDSPDPLPV